MARNEEHTMQFLAKVLWKYRGAGRRSEIVQRLLEYDCIRRNYSKGTLINIVQQFKAWLEDPESKHAKRLPHVYRYYLELLKAEDLGQETPTPDQPAPEPVEVEEDLSTEAKLNIVKAAKEQFEDKYKVLYRALEMQQEELNIQRNALIELASEKNQEFETVMQNLYKELMMNKMYELKLV